LRLKTPRSSASMPRTNALKTVQSSGEAMVSIDDG
jgi:hypothetical protein